MRQLHGELTRSLLSLTKSRRTVTETAETDRSVQKWPTWDLGILEWSIILLDLTENKDLYKMSSMELGNDSSSDTEVAQYYIPGE